MAFRNLGNVGDSFDEQGRPYERATRFGCCCYVVLQNCRARSRLDVAWWGRPERRRLSIQAAPARVPALVLSGHKREIRSAACCRMFWSKAWRIKPTPRDICSAFFRARVLSAVMSPPGRPLARRACQCGIPCGTSWPNSLGCSEIPGRWSLGGLSQRGGRA